MIQLNEVENGLEIVVTEPEEFKEAYEDKINTANVFDLLEDSRYIGNGWWDVTGKIGLTEADAIGKDVDVDDDGEYLFPEGSKVYYYNNYMLRSFVEELMTEGKVFFHLAN